MSAIRKHSDRFTETELDDEIVVMRIDTGEFFALTGSAAATWRLIDGRRHRSEIIDILRQEFGAEGDQIASDVDEFLVRLEDAGFLAGD